jgi:predicted nucleic acid-binding protein
VPPTAGVSCSDPDDQKFIDLAVQHKCLLLSKDGAVLTMEKRLAALEVSVLCALPT